ncbi:glutathione S-transferase family protein [Roseospira marina]|uniref:Glutathione S-transferase family protein n=1 Tax=Roseospira marina TaxID=140057 RepID=A0A5M6IFD4_9PROT|nr:glutathione S-transferase family protein [Roseospira marina]KAA5606981.1 glutathione S-transferase family protein [Roseospira marina]MBB4312839.1 glutathione S-transferase [Roseospira marina]MBB5086388.1 glutathione S-transferase [Roseospira marina]
MSDLTLVLGNKAYSSWSLRPWLALRVAGIPFHEEVIALDQPDTRERILRHSPAGRVPVLHDGAVTLWESLAILEYIAERHPEAGLWPDSQASRAFARAVTSEMHAGFAPLRAALPMNLREGRPGLALTAEVQRDVDRVCALWRDCRSHHRAGGPFLFGRFTNADAMFAPVATRFRTYGVPLDDLCGAYVQALYDLPALQQWIAEAQAEPWVIEAVSEIGKP